jgi:hypothetical protein
MGLGSALFLAMRLDFLPLTISFFVFRVWYFNWQGGADARVLIGLWGLWPLAGLLGMGLHRFVGTDAGLTQAGEGTHPCPGHGWNRSCDSIYFRIVHIAWTNLNLSKLLLYTFLKQSHKGT